MTLSFPPYFLLIPYGIFFLTIIFTVLFNIKHIVALGAESFISFLVTLATVAYIFAVVIATFWLLALTDWTTPITIWNQNWIGSINIY
jgi:hypothetical protein